MQTTTIEAMMAILRSDGTVNPADRQRLAGLLRGETNGEPMQDRILRRSEAARLLGRSPKSVDRLAMAGLLKKVRFGTYKRSAGFRMSDVARLIAEGKA